MVQYHYVHTATTIQAHPGLSEGTIHHSYTYGSIPLCTSGLSEGTLRHSYTHGSIPSCTSGLSEGSVHHFYTHGSRFYTIKYIQLLHSGLSEGILYSVHMQYSV